MGYTASTISGGFADPDSDGLEPPGTTINAVYEYSDFVDQIVIDLDNADPEQPPYLSINNVTTTVTLSGTPITLTEISNNEVTLNLTYSEPTTNAIVGLNIQTSYTSSTGNVYISGNISGAFPDSYWEYKDLSTSETSSVTSALSIPEGDIGLYLYKPSFMRYTNVIFTVDVEYTTPNENVSYEIRKKIVNNWDINRLAVISQVSREDAYRSSNYPKE